MARTFLNLCKKKSIMTGLVLRTNLLISKAIIFQILHIVSTITGMMDRKYKQCNKIWKLIFLLPVPNYGINTCLTKVLN